MPNRPRVINNVAGQRDKGRQQSSCKESREPLERQGRVIRIATTAMVAAATVATTAADGLVNGVLATGLVDMVNPPLFEDDPVLHFFIHRRLTRR